MKHESFLVTRRDLLSKFGVTAPERGQASEQVLLDRHTKVEHTDLHRPTGARLFRLTWMGAASPASKEDGSHE